MIQCNDLLIYKERDKYVFLTYGGDVILKASYDDILPFVGNNSYTYACDNREWLLINENGEEVNNETYYSIAFSEKLKSNYTRWYYYAYWLESDYVDLCSEAEKISSLIPKECVDKIPYNVTPNVFADIYDKEYKVSDLEDVYEMKQGVLEEENFSVELLVEYIKE